MVNWKKTMVAAFCIVIAAYLLVAVTAFSKNTDGDAVCSDVRISIERGAIDGFLTTAEVNRMLIDAKVYPVGKKLSDVNLREMEERLQAQQLIDNAECYKTQDGRIAISVEERVPVVRVMSQGGDDYYVDEDGAVMANTGYTCKLLVATGSIDRAFASRVLAPLGRLVVADDFWRNQIEQVNVLPDSTLELVPRVGDHVVCLGRPEGIARKLERLRKFYQYGLSQTGWNKYARISVEYDNQIVCKKK